MTSWHGEPFRITGLLWGKSTGDRWFPLQKAIMMSLDFFLTTWITSWTKNASTVDVNRRYAMRRQSYNIGDYNNENGQYALVSNAVKQWYLEMTNS